jgi:DNA modification methylase
MIKTSEQSWPAWQVKRRPLAALLPYARNARTHSPAQVKQIAASIAEWGWTMPVLVDDDGVLIAGHGRVLAAQGLGISDVPTMTASGWTEAQVKAYRIADNKLTLNAGWDEGLLTLELGELQGFGFDLALTGFGLDELAGLLDSNAGLTDPDDAPPAPDAPVSRAGDVWRLGRHRLLCGDATREVDVDTVLGEVRPHLMVTDPPYGVSYDSKWRDDTGLTRAKQVAVGRVENDDRADWTDAWALFPGDVAYVWHGGLHGASAANSLAAVGLEVRAQIIWVKQGFVFGRGHYHWQHEPCFYAVRRGSVGAWAGDRKQTTVWQIENANKMKGGRADDMTTGHSTQKPVECMRRPIENNSSPGQAVYEPFSGSGTTIIAAEMTGRSCHAIEISPAYIDVAVLRWQAFTGQEAVLDSTGQSYAATATERLQAAA